MLTTEAKRETKRDPKVYGAILGLKMFIKTMGKRQKRRRLKKQQKDIYDAMEITVALRHYLRLRGKEFQEVHKIREGLEWVATRADKKLSLMFNL